jgi:hypothetical protein
MGMDRRSIIFTGLAVVSVLSPGGDAFATPVYQTTFDNLDSDFALTQQGAPDLWETNDPYVPATGAGQTEIVAQLAGYSAPANTDLWAILGGLAVNEVPEPGQRAVPGSFSIGVWKPFSSAGLLTGGADAHFIRLEVDFAITSSGLGRPNEDSFSWDFGTASGESIFRLALEPTSTSPERLSLKWYNSAGEATQTPNSLAYDAIYHLQVDVALDSASRDAFTVRITDGFGVTSTVLSNVTLPDGAANSLARVGARWDILDPAMDANGHPSQYGANAIVFNDFGIATVPEPATGLLLCGGALCCLGRRRRR